MQSQNVPYQKQYTFQERQLECKSIMEKHPETIPIIVEKNLKSKLELSDKKKFFSNISFDFYIIFYKVFGFKDFQSFSFDLSY